MKLFSERKGLTKPRTEFQIESIDDKLKNRLWSVLCESYFTSELACNKYTDETSETMWMFLSLLWNSYFKKPTDTIGRRWSSSYKFLRGDFFSAPWYSVYDFIEFVVNNYPDEDEQVNERAIAACNSVLESEMSGHRFVGKQITPITSKEEMLR